MERALDIPGVFGGDPVFAVEKMMGDSCLEIPRFLCMVRGLFFCANVDATATLAR